MKISSIFLPLMFFGIWGCAQNEHQHTNIPGKIPIDGNRWYQLTNAHNSMGQLFNGITDEKPNTGWGKLLTNYDAWYPLEDGERMEIDSIAMFCWRGIDAHHPMTIYAVTDDWKRVPIAIFNGQRADSWIGPDPENPGVFALKTPVSKFRYLIINSWGEFPGEIEFYGAYTPPKPVPPVVKKAVPLSNFFGINAYEWDFEDPKNALTLDTGRLKTIKNFTAVRHYLDWDKLEMTEGDYTFNPAKNGSWNYDTIYAWCQAQNIDVLACIKTIPKWLENTYPDGQRNNENIPARYGKNLLDPASYIEQAKLAFQYAARYGGNKNVDPKLMRVDTTIRWKGDTRNEVRIGLGLIKYIECDNERDKWWKGRNAYQTGREYAANLSAFYDGNKGKMGPGVGVKTADPGMKVVMAGLADPKTDYVRGMIDWSREFRGLKPDGSVDLPWDIINFHFYCNDANGTDKEQTVGMAPELTNAGQVALDFITLAHKYAGDMPVWVTETGYDVNAMSPQRAQAANGKNPIQTQADWILRTSLLYSSCGIQKVFFYQLNDDNPKSTARYGTSGFINANKANRPAADYFAQVNKLFGTYSYKGMISQNPRVYWYTFNNQNMYALVMPAQNGKTTSYNLDLGNASFANIYIPNPGKDTMDIIKKKTINGKVDVTVIETPVFVTGQ